MFVHIFHTQQAERVFLPTRYSGRWLIGQHVWNNQKTVDAKQNSPFFLHKSVHNIANVRCALQEKYMATDSHFIFVMRTNWQKLILLRQTHWVVCHVIEPYHAMPCYRGLKLVSFTHHFWQTVRFEQEVEWMHISLCMHKENIDIRVIICYCDIIG